MAFQYGATLRNSQVALIQTTVGGSGVLKIFSGAEPVNCAAADPSGLLATITLPAVFLTTAGAVTTLAGSWNTGSASATGTPACFRIYDGSAVCHVQGSVADLVFSPPLITSGQPVAVTTFSVTGGNG